ncbi:MAG: amidohydrolase family protein [Clostridiales bacterium]|nr:amidohydrolase family protein [Clostridiales bacterium]
MRRIIDAHCHIYPDGISRRAVDAVDRFYDGLPSDHYDGTVQTLLRVGRENGVTHFVVHSVATRPEQVRSINQFIARSVREADGAFVGMGTLHPESQEIRQDFRELIGMGLHGVKLHPDIQHFHADDPKAMQIYALCEEQGCPIVVHTGDYRYDYSNPSRIVPILKAFPRLKLVGAHFGGWSVWEDAVRELPAYPNILVDTSSSLYWLKPERAREIIRIWGVERVLYGTDYPLWPQKQEIDALLALGLSPKEYERIFWKNAAELFGLNLKEEEDSNE